VYSILQKETQEPIFVGFTLNILSEPYKTEYELIEILKDDLYRVDFNLDLENQQR
jgi:KUP system potassium uptake protein